MSDTFSQISLDEARQDGYFEGHADGLQEGIEAGLQEGTLLALRAALLRMLAARFGAASSAVRLRVASETESGQLYAWMDQVLAAGSMEGLQDLWN